MPLKYGCGENGLYGYSATGPLSSTTPYLLSSGALAFLSLFVISIYRKGFIDINNWIFHPFGSKSLNDTILIATRYPVWKSVNREGQMRVKFQLMENNLEIENGLLEHF